MRGRRGLLRGPQCRAYHRLSSGLGQAPPPPRQQHGGIMCSSGQNPEHDKSFAAVAPRLAEWHMLQGLRPSVSEWAWSRAGFALVYATAISRHVAYWYAAGAVAFLPAWTASSTPIYRTIRWSPSAFAIPATTAIPCAVSIPGGTWCRAPGPSIARGPGLAHPRW